MKMNSVETVITARQQVEQLLAIHPESTPRTLAKTVGCSVSYASAIAQEHCLRALGSLPTPAIAYARQVASATLDRLDVLAQRVNEGKDLVTASEFGRWLTVAGLPKLIGAFSRDDGVKLDQKTSALVSECAERFRTGSTEPKFEAIQLRSLQEQISNLTEIVLQQKAA